MFDSFQAVACDRVVVVSLVEFVELLLEFREFDFAVVDDAVVAGLESSVYLTVVVTGDKSCKSRKAIWNLLVGHPVSVCWFSLVYSERPRLQYSFLRLW